MTKTTSSLDLSNYEYYQQYGEYFYFRKSYSGNAGAYKVRLDIAEDLFAKTFNDKIVFYETLKEKTGDVKVIYERLTERFFNKLKTKAHGCRHQYWHSQSDIFYTFSERNTHKDFIKFIDLYRHTILPNYPKGTWHVLDESQNTVKKEIKQHYETVYDMIAQEIDSKNDKNYNEVRASRSGEVAVLALELLLKDKETHLHKAVQALKENLETKQSFMMNYSNQRIIVNEEASIVFNTLIKDLLTAAANPFNYNKINAHLLERIDIYDHKVFEAIAKYLKKRVSKYNNTHRDIIVKVK